VKLEKKIALDTLAPLLVLLAKAMLQAQLTLLNPLNP